jgi:CubicO group peptidase (beta-lactamase class C family)
MLLGFALEDAAGASLDRSVARWAPPGLRYGVEQSERSRVAPTERRAPDGDVLRGEVHDENARALGGAPAHAGMFGTVGAVGAFARMVLRTWKAETPLGRPDTLRRFATRSTVPRSSRALGWDTMLPTSSCGTRLSERAIGHTGFTGTSLWVDPARDLYVVLLTNRVHPTRENTRWLEVRPAVHDAIVRATS